MTLLPVAVYSCEPSVVAAGTAKQRQLHVSTESLDLTVVNPLADEESALANRLQPKSNPALPHYEPLGLAKTQLGYTGQASAAQVQKSAGEAAKIPAVEMPVVEIAVVAAENPVLEIAVVEMPAVEDFRIVAAPGKADV